MPEEQALLLRARLEDFERTHLEFKGMLRHKPHLVLGWLADLFGKRRYSTRQAEASGAGSRSWPSQATDSLGELSDQKLKER